MKKTLLLLLAVMFLCGCQTVHSLESDIQSIRIGYCPTMQSYAENLIRQNVNTELISFRSADEVLRGMKNNLIDIALIGRKAKSEEIGGVAEKRIESPAYTLIAPEKQMIDYRGLGNFEIKTCLDENATLEKFPELNPVFGDCRFADGGIWLISWDEFTDEMDLLIPVDENGNKIAKYRTPFLYGEEALLGKLTIR